MYYFKKMLFALILITSSFCYSQDPELFENTWYLHHFEYNGDIYQHTPNEEVSFITIEFDNDTELTTYVCNYLASYILTWNDNDNTFFPSDDFTQTLGSCDLGYNENFESLYFGFFFNGQVQSFGYEIILTGGALKTLIITNGNGEQAVYGNYQLSTTSYEKQIVAFYPNPTKDILHIKQGASQNDIEISIIDVNGKIVLKTSNKSLNQIDISHLDKGLYFAKVKTSDNKTQIEKIIKQ